ncbi:MAG TPA: hypothetical protein VMZ53_23085 [Kofleriaceae bacterium]|nr:hypothetical protein [Kofleriaceae bacterium]
MADLDPANLLEIRIETNDSGPWAEDAEWVFVMRDGTETRFGNGQITLSAIQWLPGFDNDAVIRAMTCTDNETFIVWRRPEQPSN